MGKSYSDDLRWRVVGAIDAGLSKMQVHQTFQISRSTIDDWLTLRDLTGSVQAHPADPPHPRAHTRGLAAQAAFGDFAQRHQHCTLAQMRLAWQAATQQRLSTMTFSRALRHCGYTRKKRATCIRNGVPQSGPPLCNTLQR